MVLVDVEVRVVVTKVVDVVLFIVDAVESVMEGLVLMVPLVLGMVMPHSFAINVKEPDIQKLIVIFFAQNSDQLFLHVRRLKIILFLPR
ncbi:hypothetical protein NL676_009026 [Syzygium grande]|nr:hypothetical protein NL676_009026 [Syzygium grande]